MAKGIYNSLFFSLSPKPLNVRHRIFCMWEVVLSCWKKASFRSFYGQVFKRMSECVWHVVWIDDLRKKGPVTLVAIIAHHTTTLVASSVGISWIIIVNLLSWEFTSTVLKPSFTVKQNEFDVWFITIRPMMVPVHKILFCFMLCVVQFMTHSCLKTLHFLWNSDTTYTTLSVAAVLCCACLSHSMLRTSNR
jgi:hypothetical protein